jgi:hypothetical protein
MKLFKCQACSQVLYFENTRCERCSRLLGYSSQELTLLSLGPENDLWRTFAKPRRLVQFCENAAYDACNWLMDADSPGTLCAACCHNHTISDLTIDDNLRRWRRLELAKHWLFYSLQRLRLPLKTRLYDPEHGLAFDFLADSPSPTGPKVLTGHDNGLITIALEEADDVERERRRTDMREPYRSLLGHFRHEIDHYFWDVLIRDGNRLDGCRSVFGDNRQDYGTALQMHYQNGPPQTGRSNMSAPMQPRIPGRIGLKPGHTICISWIRLRWPAPPVYGSNPV